jgi:hypothetical protein
MTPPLNCPFFLEQVLLTDGWFYKLKLHVRLWYYTVRLRNGVDWISSPLVAMMIYALVAILLFCLVVGEVDVVDFLLKRI